MKSSFKFECPGCGGRIEATEMWSGMTIPCPHCGNTLIVPGVPGVRKPAVPGVLCPPEEKTAGTPETFKFACPACRGRIEATAVWRGVTIPCPHCGKKIVVPKQSPEELLPEPDPPREAAAAPASSPTRELSRPDSSAPTVDLTPGMNVLPRLFGPGAGSKPQSGGEKRPPLPPTVALAPEEKEEARLSVPPVEPPRSGGEQQPPLPPTVVLTPGEKGEAQLSVPPVGPSPAGGQGAVPPPVQANPSAGVPGPRRAPLIQLGENASAGPEAAAPPPAGERKSPLVVLLMRILGNVVWLLFGGLESGIMLLISGCLACLTIIGIPCGLQLFKFAMLSLCPFGAEVKKKPSPLGCLNLVFNILWLLFGGLLNALGFLLIGGIFFCTVVGIPFALQYFKLAKLMLSPFGKVIERPGGIMLYTYICIAAIFLLKLLMLGLLFSR